MTLDIPQSEQVPRSIERVLDLLEIVIAETGCSLTTAAANADLTPTTALRYLRALEARGYLDRDEQGLFHPGATLQRIAVSLHDGGLLEGLLATAQPHLEALAASSGESVYLVVSDGRTATYVATAESSRAIRHVGWVGQNVPIEGTAAGAAFETPGTPVVRTGAVEPDITAISMALQGTFGIAVAVSIVGPDQRLVGNERAQAVSQLSETVLALTGELGLLSTSNEVAS